jgi:hypothetical protein
MSSFTFGTKPKSTTSVNGVCRDNTDENAPSKKRAKTSPAKLPGFDASPEAFTFGCSGRGAQPPSPRALKSNRGGNGGGAAGSKQSNGDVPVLVDRESRNCKCGTAGKLLKANTAANPNRKFFSCPRQRNDPKNCGFFEWADEKSKSAGASGVASKHQAYNVSLFNPSARLLDEPNLYLLTAISRWCDARSLSKIESQSVGSVLEEFVKIAVLASTCVKKSPDALVPSREFGPFLAAVSTGVDHPKTTQWGGEEVVVVTYEPKISCEGLKIVWKATMGLAAAAAANVPYKISYTKCI